MSNETLKKNIAVNSTIPAATKPTILQMLDQYKGQIAAALPKHLTADRMARIVTTEVRKTPDLLKCDPISLFGAIIQCSQLGLEPGNSLGHAYLIPFYNNKTKQKEAQLMIGYRGMIDLSRRSGQVLSINAYEIYASDEFDVVFGTDPSIMHKRDIKTGGIGEIVGVYAVAKLKDGGCQFEVMTKAQVDEIMAKSLDKIDAAYRKYSPWVNHYNEMAKKTAIRKLFKYLPVSIEIQQAVVLDEQAEAGISQSTLLFPDAIDIGEAPEVQDVNSNSIDPGIVDKAKEMFS